MLGKIYKFLTTRVANLVFGVLSVICILAWASIATFTTLPESIGWVFMGLGVLFFALQQISVRKAQLDLEVSEQELNEAHIKSEDVHRVAQAVKAVFGPLRHEEKS